MNVLTDEQLQELSKHLDDALGRYEPLREELLDHLACLIEEEMAAGSDYTGAKKKALDRFTKDEVKKTEGRTLYFVHTKPVLMKIFSFLGIALALGIISLPVREKQPIPPKAVESKPGFAEFAAQKDPPDIYPLSGDRKITAAYGLRIHPILKKEMLHRGVDFKAPLGTPIVATADGVVESAGEQKLYGLKVVIQHDGEYKSLYAHLSEIKVKAGEKIRKGTVIGRVGSSGISTAPHLHYEIIKDGAPVDPAEYLPKS